jgi:hypothetical protein
MLKLLTIILALNTTVFACEALNIIDHHHRRSIKVMDRVDINNDRLITEIEFFSLSKSGGNNPKMIKRFNRINLDNDQFLTYRELDAWFNR